MQKTDEFFSTTYGKVSGEEVISIIKNFLAEDPNGVYSLVIGTDSHERMESKNGRKAINLVTALVVYRKGHGGKYFWRRKMEFNIYSLRQKVYAETLASLDFARTFVPTLQNALNGNMPQYNLEIHIDVGEYGATREMIKEVVGMVTGNGFIAKTKPYSFAASNVADKHT